MGINKSTSANRKAKAKLSAKTPLCACPKTSGVAPASGRLAKLCHDTPLGKNIAFKAIHATNNIAVTLLNRNTNRILFIANNKKLEQTNYLDEARFHCRSSK